ncbi:hypothetical protein [Streptomyces sp. WAC05950]|nr:hypothetical protein [Streptomyces sp. WAC05950]
MAQTAVAAYVADTSDRCKLRTLQSKARDASALLQLDAGSLQVGYLRVEL